MNEKNLIFGVITVVGIIFTILTNTQDMAFAQKGSVVTDAQKYKTGYNIGKDNSQSDFDGLRGHACDSTVPAGHTVPFQKGYSVGYSEGPCGNSRSVSSQSNPSSPVPGLIFSR